MEREEKIKLCYFYEKELNIDNKMSYEFLDDKPLEKWYNYLVEEMDKEYIINNLLNI